MRDSILHFNDCYILDNLSALYQCKFNNNALLTFGGDYLGPSFISTFDKGKHINKIFKIMEVDLGVFGNHEFDFGVEHLEEQMFENKPTTWLITNCLMKNTTLNGTSYFVDIINNVLVGFIGLVHYDTSLIFNYQYQDKIKILKYDRENINYYIKLLKRKYKCERIVLLSHCGISFDRLIANELPIDLILGGHNHIINDEIINHTRIIHCGQDAEVSCLIKPHHRGIIDVNWINLKTYQKNKELEKIIFNIQDFYNTKYNKIICKSNKKINIMDKYIRNYKSIIGEFMSKIMYHFSICDYAMINSGSIRSNRIINKGDYITIKDCISIFPFENYLVKVKMRVKHLKEMIKYSRDDIGNNNGKFMCIFPNNYDYDLEYEDEDEYRVIILIDYLYEGGDGFYHFEKYGELLDIERKSYQKLLIERMKFI